MIGEDSGVLSTCSCCGYRTLPRPADTTTLPCPVCAWDFREHASEWGTAGERLTKAQQCFLRTGSSDLTLAEFTRLPRSDEARAPWWRPIHEAPAALIALVETAFADVQLDGGVSFAEAERIDSYDLSSRTEHDPPPSGFGSGPAWQSLTLKDLDRYHWGNFAFQDLRGIRYHLPAFLCVHLRGQAPGALGSLFFTLTANKRLLHFLSEAQRHAVARYLGFLAINPPGYHDHGHAALEVLRDRWGLSLDPEELALVLALPR